MRKLPIVGAVAFMLIALVPGMVEAEALYFFNTGSWNSLANWYVPDPAHPGQYTLAGHTPNQSGGDDVTIDGVCDATGVTASLLSLTIWQGNTSVTNGNFDVGGLNFILQPGFAGSGSTNGMTGSYVNVRASGAINFADSGTYMNNCQLIMQGGSFANVTVGPTFSGTTIFNEGSFVIQSGTAVTFAGSNNRVDNIGDIRGNGGTAAFNAGAQNLILNNSGTIAAYADGNLVINGNIIWTAEDTTHDGSFFPVTAGAKITIQGAFVVPLGATDYFKGPGTVITTGGVTINGTLKVGVPASGPSENAVLAPAQADPGKWLIKTSTPITISSGASLDVENQSKVIVAVNYITSDDSTGNIEIKSGGEFDINGASNNGNGNGQDFVTSGGGNVINHGTVALNIRSLGANLLFTNAPDGVVNSYAEMAWYAVSDPSPFWHNYGEANLIGGTSQNPPSGFGVVYNGEPGSVLNVSGTGAFNLYRGGTLDGTFTAPPTISFNFTNGQFTAQPSLDFGDSQVSVSNAAELKWGNYTTHHLIKNFQLKDLGVVDGSGNLIITNSFDWQGGEIDGTHFIFNPGSHTEISGFGTKSLNGASITNYGTCTWTGGQINSSNGTHWSNEGGSNFDVLGDDAWNSDGTTRIDNNNLNASFGKIGGTGTTQIAPIFNNNGTVSIKSGTLAFCNFEQAGGVTQLLGGDLSTICGMPLVFDGGGCGGDGTITGDVVIGTTVGGVQVIWGPGNSPGKMTINGNLTLGAGSLLNLQIAGLMNPGVDYDRVEVTGTVTLGGRLRVSDINGFTPGGSDTIVPLTAGSFTGKFASTNAQVNYDNMSLTVAALPSPLVQLLNISTRMRVLSGENVLIAGFIITGNDPKTVIIRGIGPSLLGIGVQGALPNPTLELQQGAATLATNDDWKTRPDGSSQQAEIEATTIPPTNNLESALVATLNPGAYTAILAGSGGGTGVGLVEVYDLAQAANSQIANISTRGFVDTNDNVMIGGIIAGPNNGFPSRILVRAIGPSLQNAGIANPLGDPTLEVRDVNGGLLASDDDWKMRSDGSSQQAEIEATSVPPIDDFESAVLQSVTPGNYTAIVRGKNNATGVGLVEVYNLQ